jgi:hypothetical protein
MRPATTFPPSNTLAGSASNSSPFSSPQQQSLRASLASVPAQGTVPLQIVDASGASSASSDETCRLTQLVQIIGSLTSSVSVEEDFNDVAVDSPLPAQNAKNMPLVACPPKAGGTLVDHFEAYMKQEEARAKKEAEEELPQNSAATRCNRQAIPNALELLWYTVMRSKHGLQGTRWKTLVSGTLLLAFLRCCCVSFFLPSFPFPLPASRFPLSAFPVGGDIVNFFLFFPFVRSCFPFQFPFSSFSFVPVVPVLSSLSFVPCSPAAFASHLFSPGK